MDILMPEMDGWAVCQDIRARDKETGIIFLSSMDEEVDRILGLKVGGDDYVCKPFSTRELSARVRRLVDRLNLAAGDPAPAKVLSRGLLQMNTETRRVAYDCRPVDLTPTEYGYLKVFLSANRDALITKDRLAEHGYGDEPRSVNDETVVKHVSKIRLKFHEACGLGADTVIVTAQGMGYRLANCDAKCGK